MDSLYLRVIVLLALRGHTYVLPVLVPVVVCNCSDTGTLWPTHPQIRQRYRTHRLSNTVFPNRIVDDHFRQEYGVSSMSPGDRSRYNEHEKEQPCGVSSHHPLLQDSTTCLSNVTTGRIGPRSALPVTTTKSEQIIVFESAVTKITGNEDGFVSPSVVYPLILFPQRVSTIFVDVTSPATRLLSSRPLNRSH